MAYSGEKKKITSMYSEEFWEMRGWNTATPPNLMSPLKEGLWLLLHVSQRENSLPKPFSRWGQMPIPRISSG